MARDYWFAFGTKPSTYTGLAPTFITFVNSSGQTIAPPTITETYSGTGLYKVNYNATQTIAFVMDGATTGLSDSLRYIFGVFDPNDQFGATLVNVSDRTVTLIALGTTNVALGTSNVALGTTILAQGAALGSSLGAVSATLIAQGATLVGFGTSLAAAGATLSGVAATLVAEGATVVAIGNTLAAIGTTLGSINLTVDGIGSTASSFGDSTTDPVTVFGYLKRLQEFLEGDQSYTKASGALTFSSRGSSTLLASKTVSDSNTETTKT